MWGTGAWLPTKSPVLSISFYKYGVSLLRCPSRIEGGAPSDRWRRNTVFEGGNQRRWKGAVGGTRAVCSGATTCPTEVKLDTAGGPAVASEARRPVPQSCRAQLARAPMLPQMFPTRYRSIQDIVSRHGNHVYDFTAVVLR